MVTTIMVQIMDVDVEEDSKILKGVQLVRPLVLGKVLLFSSRLLFFSIKKCKIDMLERR